MRTLSTEGNVHNGSNGDGQINGHQEWKADVSQPRSFRVITQSCFASDSVGQPISVSQIEESINDPLATFHGFTLFPYHLQYRDDCLDRNYIRLLKLRRHLGNLTNIIHLFSNHYTSRHDFNKQILGTELYYFRSGTYSHILYDRDLLL